MSPEPAREASNAMQTETPEKTPESTPKSKTAARSGRSSIDRLPDDVRAAVDAAIADGATIDQIAERIRAAGETCSRSAVGRYAKNARDLVRQQQESDRAIEAWVKAFGERTPGLAGLILIETLRTMVLATMTALSAREEPVSTQELNRLSVILKRIEDTDKLRMAREQAAKKAAATAAGKDQEKKGLSPEAMQAIREVVLGPYAKPPHTITSVPVDPWNPAKDPLSVSTASIPPNPGKSRKGNGRHASG